MLRTYLLTNDVKSDQHNFVLKYIFCQSHFGADKMDFSKCFSTIKESSLKEKKTQFQPYNY